MAINRIRANPSTYASTRLDESKPQAARPTPKREPVASPAQQGDLFETTSTNLSGNGAVITRQNNNGG